MSFFDSTQSALEAAMRGSSVRQTLLSDNLANVNTPGYQRQDVDFHATLQAAEAAGTPLDSLTFQGTTDPTRTVRADGSGIDADEESSDLAQNGLEYEALVQVASARFGILRSAMGTGS